MKRRISILLILSTLILFTSCSNSPSKDANETTVDSAQQTTVAETTASETPGELKNIYVPKYAKGFTIEYYNGGAKIISTNIKETNNSEAISQRILILPENSVEPLNAKWDFKFDKEIKSIVGLASSIAGHLSQISAIDYLKGTSISQKNCQIPTLKEALDNGSSTFVGQSSKIDKELVVSLKPDITFVGGMKADIEVAGKLGESGIFSLYLGDAAEEDFFGRAQWIELIGAFISKEDEAREIFNQNVVKTDEIIAKAKQIGKTPNILWFIHSSAEPHWNVKTNIDYVNSIVTALGGKLICPENSTTNSVKMSNEDFISYMNIADIIIFGMSLNSYPDAKDILYFNKESQIDFSTTNAFKNDKCYVVGYDWSQDTGNIVDILQSTAACLYPDDFTAPEKSKIIKFNVE